MRFNRLKELSEDQSVISAALKKSTSGLMQVSKLLSSISSLSSLHLRQNWMFWAKKNTTHCETFGHSGSRLVQSTGSDLHLFLSPGSRGKLQNQTRPRPKIAGVQQGEEGRSENPINLRCEFCQTVCSRQATNSLCSKNRTFVLQK